MLLRQHAILGTSILTFGIVHLHISINIETFKFKKNPITRNTTIESHERRNNITPIYNISITIVGGLLTSMIYL